MYFVGLFITLKIYNFEFASDIHRVFFFYLCHTKSFEPVPATYGLGQGTTWTGHQSIAVYTNMCSIMEVNELS